MFFSRTFSSRLLPVLLFSGVVASSSCAQNRSAAGASQTLSAKPVGVQKVALKTPRLARWNHVFVGGGGTVTYITRSPNPKVAQLWAASDVAGPMSYDFKTNAWTHRADAWSIDNVRLQHTELVALDGQNPDHVLYSAGKEWLSGPNAIVLSNDGGKNWTPVPLRTRKGEEAFISNGRTGKRLALDPNNGQIGLYGSRQNGLFKTLDGGQSWQQVEILPGEPMDGVTVGFVGFDPTSRGAQGSKTIYLRAWPAKPETKFPTATYRSTDGGNTWRALPDAPRNCWLGYVQNDGAFYQVGEGLYRWNGQGWDDLTPPTRGQGHNFHAFVVSPTNSRWLALAEDHCGGGNAVQRSRDGGKTWERFSDDDAFGRGANTVEGVVQPWEGGNNGKHLFQCTSSFEVDPTNPNRIWMTYWPGLATCDDFWTAKRQTWRVNVQGHEEICLFDMTCPPKANDGTVVAPLFSGAMDVGGFAHFDISKQPEQMYVGVELSQWNRAPEDVTGLDFCESDPRHVALVGGWKYLDYNPYPTKNGGGGTSSDGGKTWTKFGSLPYEDAKNGHIAVNAADPNNLVWIPRDSLGKKNSGQTPAYVSRDGGQTWTASQGAPTGLIFDDFVYTFYSPLASDRVKANTFYIYDSRDGRFYCSNDGGAHFAPRAQIAAQPTVHFRRHFVRAAPGLEGEVWVAADDQGLFRSSNAGDSFTKLEGITKALAFGWGAPLANSRTPVAFLLGHIAGDTTPQPIALYRSLDLGATWQRLNDATLGWAQATSVQGDRQTPGRVYVGTNGRGIFVADTASLRP